MGSIIIEFFNHDSGLYKSYNEIIESEEFKKLDNLGRIRCADKIFEHWNTVFRRDPYSQEVEKECVLWESRLTRLIESDNKKWEEGVRRKVKDQPEQALALYSELKDDIDSQNELEPSSRIRIELAKRLNYINKRTKNKTNINVQSQNQKVEPQKSNNTITNSDVKWEGTKTELAEIIHAIFISDKVRVDAEPILQKDLVQIFNNIFTNIDLKSSDIPDLLKKSFDTFKVGANKKLYIKEFSDKLVKKLTDQYD